MTIEEHYAAARAMSIALGALATLLPWCDVGQPMAEVRGCVLALWSSFSTEYPGERNPYSEVP